MNAKQRLLASTEVKAGYTANKIAGVLNGEVEGLKEMPDLLRHAAKNAESILEAAALAIDHAIKIKQPKLALGKLKEVHNLIRAIEN